MTYKPGESGNPNGRPKGSRAKLHVELDEAVEKASPEILDTLIQRARTGDAACAELLLKRIWPRRAPRIRFTLRPIETIQDLVGALGDVLRQVADEIIAPQEAQHIASLVGAMRSAMELVHVEQRLDAIEAALARARLTSVTHRDITPPVANRDPPDAPTVGFTEDSER
jgi:hypothetical protein